MRGAASRDTSPDNASIAAILVQDDGGLRASQATAVSDPWAVGRTKRFVALDVGKCSMLREVGFVGRR